MQQTMTVEDRLEVLGGTSAAGQWETHECQLSGAGWVSIRYSWLDPDAPTVRSKLMCLRDEAGETCALAHVHTVMVQLVFPGDATGGSCACRVREQVTCSEDVWLPQSNRSLM